MNWIEIVRLIIVLWPLIEKILEGENEETKTRKADALTSAMAVSLTRPEPQKPIDFIADIAKILA